MEHELIDELDENGNLIGRVDKAVAHQKGLWHRSVHVWLVNDNNEILLQHRCSEKNFFPNVWDCSFAGHVSAGEESLLTVIREGKEEIGIDVDTNKLKYLFTVKESLKYKKMISNEFVDVFILYQNYQIDKGLQQKEEVDDLKFIPIEEFIKLTEKRDKSLIPHNEEFALIKKIIKVKIKEKD